MNAYVIVGLIFLFLVFVTKRNEDIKKKSYELVAPSSTEAHFDNRKSNNMYDALGKGQLGDYTHATIPLAIVRDERFLSSKKTTSAMPQSVLGYIKGPSGTRLPVYKKGDKWHVLGNNATEYVVNVSEDSETLVLPHINQTWKIYRYKFHPYAVPWAS